jgi:hypothetical protein
MVRQVSLLPVEDLLPLVKDRRSYAVRCEEHDEDKLRDYHVHRKSANQIGRFSEFDLWAAWSGRKDSWPWRPAASAKVTIP